MWLVHQKLAFDLLCEEHRMMQGRQRAGFPPGPHLVYTICSRSYTQYPPTPSARAVLWVCYNHKRTAVLGDGLSRLRILLTPFWCGRHLQYFITSSTLLSPGLVWDFYDSHGIAAAFLAFCVFRLVTQAPEVSAECRSSFHTGSVYIEDGSLRGRPVLQLAPCGL